MSKMPIDMKHESSKRENLIYQKINSKATNREDIKLKIVLITTMCKTNKKTLIHLLKSKKLKCVLKQFLSEIS